MGNRSAKFMGHFVLTSFSRSPTEQLGGEGACVLYVLSSEASKISGLELVPSSLLFLGGFDDRQPLPGRTSSRVINLIA